MTVPTACVVGWPIAHSRSPAIHRYWLRELGIEGDYVPVAVSPDRIGAFLRDFVRDGLYVGGNVTLPHKEAAFALADRRDAAASATGSVNTLWIENGKLVGGNTDSYGFLASLDESVDNWDKTAGEAVVLGAGGAARAVLFALKERGFAPIGLVNRTVARAEALAAGLGPQVRPSPWQELPRLLAGARLLVNTTTLGMKGAPPLDIDLSGLPADAVVADIVYVPLETPLLREARARGLRAVDGLGMLLHQAAPGFERWFGRRPTVSPGLRAAVLETFGG